MGHKTFFVLSFSFSSALCVWIRFLLLLSPSSTCVPVFLLLYFPPPSFWSFSLIGLILSICHALFSNLPINILRRFYSSLISVKFCFATNIQEWIGTLLGFALDFCQSLSVHNEFLLSLLICFHRVNSLKVNVLSKRIPILNRSLQCLNIFTKLKKENRCTVITYCLLFCFFNYYYFKFLSIIRFYWFTIEIPIGYRISLSFFFLQFWFLTFNYFSSSTYHRFAF